MYLKLLLSFSLLIILTIITYLIDKMWGETIKEFMKISLFGKQLQYFFTFHPSIILSLSFRSTGRGRAIPCLWIDGDSTRIATCSRRWRGNWLYGIWRPLHHHTHRELLSVIFIGFLFPFPFHKVALGSNVFRHILITSCRRLPDSLLPSSNFDEWISFGKLASDFNFTDDDISKIKHSTSTDFPPEFFFALKDLASKLKSSFEKVPERNLAIFQWIVKLLCAISKHSEKNKMSLRMHHLNPLN